MNQADIFRIAYEQHAVDMNCRPKDFTCGEPMVVLSQANEGARAYLKNYPFFVDIACYGANVVASVDPCMEEFVRAFIRVEPPYSVFDPLSIIRLQEECARYNRQVKFLAEYWLPDLDFLQAIHCTYETRLLQNKDFTELYLPEWSNALCADRKHLDVLGVGAYENGKLIGLAACSADAEKMWQIGIDVLPEYRKKGIASALTSQLAMKILEKDIVPFYCCAWANFASFRNAYKVGFRPSWAEMTAVPMS